MINSWKHNSLRDTVLTPLPNTMANAGKQENCIHDHTESMDVRFAPEGVESSFSPWLKSYGTYNCGAEMMTSAWKNMEHVFAIRRPSVTPPRQETAAKVTTKFPRISPSFLTANSVDLLVVECCSAKKSFQGASHWEMALKETKSVFRPKVILESWDPRSNTWIRGPTDKTCITR